MSIAARLKDVRQRAQAYGALDTTAVKTVGPSSRSYRSGGLADPAGALHFDQTVSGNGEGDGPTHKGPRR